MECSKPTTRFHTHFERLGLLHTKDMELETRFQQQGITKIDWSPVTRKVKDGEDAQVAERVKFYDDHIESYDSEMSAFCYAGPAEAAKNLHKHLQGNLDANILDIGCGNGACIAELRKLAAYKNADGLDPASKSLVVGKEKGLFNNTFNQYFTECSGLPSESYDAVCCSGAFMPGHLRSECVREMHRIVKSGGYIVIVMRRSYLDSDKDLAQLIPNIQKMSKEGLCDITEEYVHDNYFGDYEGQVFVMKRAA